MVLGREESGRVILGMGEESGGVVLGRDKESGRVVLGRDKESGREVLGRGEESGGVVYTGERTRVGEWCWGSLIPRSCPELAWCHLQSFLYVLCQQSLFGVDESRSSISNY